MLRKHTHDASVSTHTVPQKACTLAHIALWCDWLKHILCIPTLPRRQTHPHLVAVLLGCTASHHANALAAQLVLGASLMAEAAAMYSASVVEAATVG
jgi:hypothetical protein